MISRFKAVISVLLVVGAVMLLTASSITQQTGATGLNKEFVAAICQSSTGSLSMNAATATQPPGDCFTGINGRIIGKAKFLNTATYAVQMSFVLASTTLTAVKMDIHWITPVTNASLGALWQVQTACTAAGGTSDPVYGSAQYAFGTANANANYSIVSTITTLTIAGCSAGSTLNVILTRVPGATGGGHTDDLGDEADLTRVLFTVT